MMEEKGERSQVKERSNRKGKEREETNVELSFVQGPVEEVEDVIPKEASSTRARPEISFGEEVDEESSRKGSIGDGRRRVRREIGRE